MGQLTKGEEMVGVKRDQKESPKILMLKEAAAGLIDEMETFTPTDTTAENKEGRNAVRRAQEYIQKGCAEIVKTFS